MKVFTPGLSRALVGAGALALAGCVTVPSGPSVMALPGTHHSFEQFQADDAVCRSFAQQQVGATPNQAATASAVTGAAVGTALGAAAGAVIGSATHSASAGAAVGAGTGLLLGTAAGADRGDFGAGAVQRRYDAAYLQCMYAKGNQIPVAAGALRSQPQAAPSAPPPMPSNVPPPPPGVPPPPPPGVR